MQDSPTFPQVAGISIYSRLPGPIERLSMLQKSLLFAELSNIAYLRHDYAAEAIRCIGLRETRFFERGGAQAYFFETDVDCVLAIRGTEPNEWNDIKADVKATTVLAETIGRVHRGFKEEVDDLWPDLEAALRGKPRAVWFTGHSLGGAMATICAGRCKVSMIAPDPRALFTYGSPRVGNKRFIHHVPIDHIRWVNNNDLVTRMPPAWMGFRHSGRELYLNAHGHMRQVTGWQRTKDRWRGFRMGIMRGEIDTFADHALDRYVEYIQRAVQATGRADDPKSHQDPSEKDRPAPLRHDRNR